MLPDFHDSNTSADIVKHSMSGIVHHFSRQASAVTAANVLACPVKTFFTGWI
jgi:hypothetical protein